MNDVFKGINNQKKNLSLTLLNIYLIETLYKPTLFEIKLQVDNHEFNYFISERSLIFMLFCLLLSLQMKIELWDYFWIILYNRIQYFPPAPQLLQEVK